MDAEPCVSISVDREGAPQPHAMEPRAMLAGGNIACVAMLAGAV